MQHSRHFVWDLPVRVFHWSLLLAVSMSYTTAKLHGLWLIWHVHAGNVIVALLVFRVGWGIMGTSTARFSNFWPSLNRIYRYRAGEYLAGHSPLAAVAVLTLLVMLALQVLTGVFGVNDEIDIAGPLAHLIRADVSRYLTSLHKQLELLLVGLIALHISTNVYYLTFKRRNLINPMLSGYTRIKPNDIRQQKMTLNKSWLALTLLVALLVFGWLEINTFQ